ncbi:MAG: N-acetylmuramoyl-L-alanine amidase [Acaryochloris sp. SU_5_25]|nr:N-acetylmuramoyl-L-alanine amidase [Acaryochloris sp. SU_5_25]
MTQKNAFLALFLSVVAGLVASAFGFWSLDQQNTPASSASSQHPPASPAPISPPIINPSDLPEVQTDIALAEPQVIPPTSVPPSSPSTTVTPTATSVPPSPYPPPREFRATVHPSNYGDRYATNTYGQPVRNNWLIVLHETVGSGMSAIHHFKTPHVKDEDQASYHTLIFLDGTIVYLVPPEKRAFGAGNSVFVGANGSESVQTNSDLPPSVNNFAYHISLETPADGNHSGPTHSGYSEAQYQSLAWLIARTGVPPERVTTHAAIDRSGERSDPRSFDMAKFTAMLQRF